VYGYSWERARARSCLGSDGKRERWDVSGPHFPGWEIYHLKGSPADQDRLYASQSNGWFGQLIQRSDDGGATWEAVGNDFSYQGEAGTHQWYDGTPHPWEFARVWHLEPSLDDPDTVYAGVEDAGLFRSTDGGKHWQELPGLRGTSRGRRGSRARAGCACTRSSWIRPHRGGSSRPSRPRARSGPMTRPDLAAGEPGPALGGDPGSAAEVGHCVHRLAMHPSRPSVLYMQKHWDVMRSDDAGESWHEVSGDLPTDFGFPIDVHAHEPETVYVVPITSDSHHFPPEGKLRVYRSRTGGDEWEPLTEGLPQEHCYVNVLRDAMAVDSLDSCGIYFGTTGARCTPRPTPGTAGRRSSVIFPPCCPSRCRRCHDRAR
jgi:BNR/Asp-box repeat.